MCKIYLATNNSAKIKAVETAFSDYEIELVSIDTKIKQPLSSEETIECAKFRAHAKSQGIRLGLEAGVTLINNKCFLCNYGVLVDNDGHEYIAGGTIYPLPDEIKDDLYQEKLELKDAMKKHFGDVITENGGTIEYLTNGNMTRVDIFIHICKLLKGEFEFNKGDKNA